MLLSIIVISLFCLNQTCLGWSFILFWEVPIWNFHLLTFALHKIPENLSKLWMALLFKEIVENSIPVALWCYTDSETHNSNSFSVRTILSVKLHFHKIVCFMSCNAWFRDWCSALLMFTFGVLVSFWRFLVF